jgi:hypothetical protein
MVSTTKKPLQNWKPSVKIDLHVGACYDPDYGAMQYRVRVRVLNQGHVHVYGDCTL